MKPPPPALCRSHSRDVRDFNVCVGVVGALNVWVYVLSSFLFSYRWYLFRGCQPPVPGVCLHPFGVWPARPCCFMRMHLHVGGGVVGAAGR